MKRELSKCQGKHKQSDTVNEKNIMMWRSVFNYYQGQPNQHMILITNANRWYYQCELNRAHFCPRDDSIARTSSYCRSENMFLKSSKKFQLFFYSIFYEDCYWGLLLVLRIRITTREKYLQIICPSGLQGITFSVWPERCWQIIRDF